MKQLQAQEDSKNLVQQVLAQASGLAWNNEYNIKEVLKNIH